MKKKISNKEIGEVIGKLAEQVRAECDFELQTALFVCPRQRVNW